MGTPNDSYLVSRIDQSITDVNNKLCDCIITVRGCNEVNANTDNYSADCINMCTGQTSSGAFSESAKYEATLPLIIELFELMLLTLGGFCPFLPLTIP